MMQGEKRVMAVLKVYTPRWLQAMLTELSQHFGCEGYDQNWSSTYLTMGASIIQYLV